jgi:hypothetical protein
MKNKECKECPWVIRNDNNDKIVNHSKKWDKKYIHEISVPHLTVRTDLKQLCE